MASLAMAAALFGGFGLSACGMMTSTAADIALMAVGTVGPEPFLHAAGVDVAGVPSGEGAGGEQAGDSPDAFGGTHRDSQCDRVQLIEALVRDPGKARAWAEVRGVKVKDIPQYIHTLTPVILRKDTAVKNHGYKGRGKFRSYLSVLQAGMAVLVDLYGEPVVKCNCGNPLAKPDSDIDFEGSRYKGEKWSGFSGEKVSYVEPRPHEEPRLSKIILADISPSGQTTGKEYTRPVGTSGNQDSEPVPTQPSSAEPSQDTPTSTDSGTPPSTDSGTPTETPSDSGSPTDTGGTTTPETETLPTDTPAGYETTTDALTAAPVRVALVAAAGHRRSVTVGG